MTVIKDLDKSIAITSLSVFISLTGKTDDFFQFHSFNIQHLYGWTHELGEKKRYVFSLQYANAWKYGDTYAFIDVSDMDNVYAELHPRLSLGKIFDRDFKFGLDHLNESDAQFQIRYEFKVG